jgi:acyl-CoA thioester hydrolase
MERAVIKPPPTKIQVRYSQVDQMGFLYHVHYYEYFEWARSDWIRNFWKPYKDIEDDGYALVVIEAHLRYHKPAYYDDTLLVEMKIVEYGNSRATFEYTVTREGEDNPLCTGQTSHCFINKKGKPTRMPKELHLRLEQLYPHD